MVSKTSLLCLIPVREYINKHQQGDEGLKKVKVDISKKKKLLKIYKTDKIVVDE